MTTRMSFGRRIYVGCKFGVITWVLAQVVIKLLAPAMTDGGNSVAAVFFFPLFWLAFWPNVMFGHFLRAGAPSWLQSLEPFFEYFVSLFVWMLISILVAVVIHTISKRHHEA